MEGGRPKSIKDEKIFSSCYNQCRKLAYVKLTSESARSLPNQVINYSKRRFPLKKNKNSCELYMSKYMKWEYTKMICKIFFLFFFCKYIAR